MVLSELYCQVVNEIEISFDLQNEVDCQNVKIWKLFNAENVGEYNS